MGWFTAKDAPGNLPAKGTISDSDWRKLQARAVKANKERADTLSREAARRREQAAAQYRNRHHN